jgi:hypothetical protein
MRRWLAVAAIGFTVSAFGQNAEPRTRLGKALESSGYVSKKYAPLYKPGFLSYALLGNSDPGDRWSIDVQSVTVQSDGPPATGIMVVATWTAYGSVPAGRTFYIDATRFRLSSAPSRRSNRSETPGMGLAVGDSRRRSSPVTGSQSPPSPRTRSTRAA